MDPLAGFLDGPRARDAFLLRGVFEPPWSVRVEDEAPLTLVAVASGAAVVQSGANVQTCSAGDLVIVHGPAPYVMADRLGTAPQAVILPDQVCSTPPGLVPTMSMFGTRTWGNRLDGGTELLIGTYQLSTEISRSLLTALPDLLVLPPTGQTDQLVAYLVGEVVRDEPGQETVLDRLLDLLLIAALRTWFTRPEAASPGWYRAHGDPFVGAALRLMQNDPAHPWTLAALAAATGSSRASLARRFSALVGEPPMTFLTNWRLTLAADLLREPSATVASVARQVGYGSAFALSAAFKRERGVSPREHRLAASA